MAFRTSHFLVLLLCFLLPDAVAAQHISVVPLETSDRGVRLEFTFTWPSSMRAALDTAGVSVLNQHALVALTGGLESASESVVMPRMGQPRATVVEANYDETTLEVASEADTLAEQLSGPVAVAGWPGLSAGEVVATVSVQAVRFDPGRMVLRRYRRVVVDVEFPVGVAAASAGSRLRAGTTNPHVAIERSALADGYIFKIPIRTDGVYRLDAAYLNRALGEFNLSVDDIEPSTIRVLGNGGKPLPALNAAPRPGDLLEVPVQVTGSGNSLSVVFYGQGPQGWEYDAGMGQWLHYTHPFSNDNYYFLKIDRAQGGGRRIAQAADPGTPEAVFDRVTGRLLREFDEVMWSKDAGTGHTWVSQRVQGGQSLAILSNVRPAGLMDGDAEVRARAAIRSNRTQPRTRLFFESNGAVLMTTTAIPVFNDETSPIASPTEVSFEAPASAASGLNLAMRLENDGSSPSAAADWVRVFYTQALRAENGYLRFATPADASGVLEFVLQGFSSEPVVWDVTQPDDVRALAVTGGGDAYRVRVAAGAGQPREIVAFTTTAYRAPDAPRMVPNQNLHGITSNPDFIIVTPDTFRVYAEELADRRRREGLVVEVADIQHIYNEFSGGLPDMRAVRDFFKFLYDRGLAVGDPLRFALLFGDGHFNFRNLGGTPPELNNWIFPYETEESYNPRSSYTSDDYFGFLDDEEGVWAYQNPPPGQSAERVDIGIGRFPVQTPAEARAVIEKIKVYESPANRGPWRTRYTFVADDGHNGLAGNRENIPDLHTQNIDVVADQVLADYPILNQKKIYGISYPRVFLTTWRQPEVRRDLLAAINSGSLIVNYSGHGKEDALAQEQVFTLEDAEALTNGDRLPLVVTATCSFGRWDLADSQSGAEVLQLNARGGAIALFTTVRLVFTSASTGSLNVGLNLALNRALMQRDEDGRPRRLGDVMRITKNTQQGLDLNNRKFNLLGDPTLRIGLPEPRVAIDQVNGQPLDGEAVPVRALDQVTINGSVQHLDGSIDAGFNGAVHLTVFDAQRRIQLPPDQTSALRSGYYVSREDLIWRGEAQAQNGAFSATFVVPKDISYSNANGKISAYAMGEEVEGGGYTYNVLVGGSSDNPPDDAEGPSIALYLNDTTFVSGGLTNPRPELIVHLHDESGINTVGAGVGHELLLVLNGDEQRAANIGEYYQSAENSYQRGVVRFPMEVYLREQNREQLDPGPHSLEVRAWDVVNNSSVASVDFYVAQSEELELRNVLNFPNPFARDTRFIFEHNKLGGTPGRVQIRIYTLAGRPIRTLDHEETLPAGVLPGGPIDVYWDGRDEDFDYVGTGVYLYKVRVEAEGGDETEVVERIEKLAVIR